MSEWIPVTEKMPKPNTKVIAYGKRCLCFFAVHKNRNFNQWEFLDGDTCHEKITHWLPLPKAPGGDV
jgi:hypothetical protein